MVSLRFPTALTLVSLVCIVIVTRSAVARQSPFGIEATAGIIEPYGSSASWAFYPELEAWIPLHAAVSGRHTTLGLSVGYWNDHVSELDHCADCTTYSYRSAVLGLRIHQALGGGRPFIRRHVGANHQFIAADYVGGSGIAGNPGHDGRVGVTSAEAGVDIVMAVSSRWTVLGGTRIGMRVGAPENSPADIQTVWRLGMSRAFGHGSPAR